MSSTATTVVAVLAIAAVLVVGVAYVTAPPPVMPTLDPSTGVAGSTNSADVQRGQWLGFFSNIISTTGNVANSYLNSEASRRAASGGTVPPNSVQYHTAAGNV